jgi:hypothetical protein
MTAPADLFRSGTGGGGKYPKLEELEGKLILIKPELIEQVPKPAQFGGKPGEMQDRLTADVVVFEDDGSYEEFDEMFLSQAGIVGAAKKCLKPGGKPFMLGRVSKVPSKIGKDQGFDTTEKIEAGLAEWLKKGGKGPKPNFAWGLNDFDENTDLPMAMAYVNANSPFAPASE